MISMTKTFRALSPSDAAEEIGEAAALLRSGGLVAFPTETVYGLGANACDRVAVERVFEAKGRPSDNPLIVHISDLGQLDSLVLPYGSTARQLMDRFWPGPLTLVLPVRPGAVSPRVTAGLDTVAVRMPAHPVALAFIAAAGVPVAGPSANSSGRPSPTEAGHVLDDLDGRIDAVIDGGTAGVGLESTVVEIVADGVVRILRPGGLTAEALLEAVDRVEYDSAAAPEPPEAAAFDAAAVEPGLSKSGPAAVPDFKERRQAAEAAAASVEPAGRSQDAAAPAEPPLRSPAAEPAPPRGLAGGGSALPAPPPAETRAAARPPTGAPTIAGAREDVGPPASLRADRDEPGAAAAPRSPGMKYAHYAPRGVMELVRGGDPAAVAAYIGARERESRAQGERTGVLAFAEHAALYRADHVLAVGSLERLETAAQGLYAALRAFDRAGVTRIWAEACPQEGIGHAFMNRLAKAAAGRIVDVK